MKSYFCGTDGRVLIHGCITKETMNTTTYLLARRTVQVYSSFYFVLRSNPLNILKTGCLFSNTLDKSLCWQNYLDVSDILQP